MTQFEALSEQSEFELVEQRTRLLFQIGDIFQKGWKLDESYDQTGVVDRLVAIEHAGPTLPADVYWITKEVGPVEDRRHDADVISVYIPQEDADARFTEIYTAFISLKTNLSPNQPDLYVLTADASTPYHLAEDLEESSLGGHRVWHLQPELAYEAGGLFMPDEELRWLDDVEFMLKNYGWHHVQGSDDQPEAAA